MDEPSSESIRMYLDQVMSDALREFDRVMIELAVNYPNGLPEDHPYYKP